MTTNLAIRVVTDSEEFKSLRETWDSLLAKSSDNDAYLTWEWLFTWWKHYGEGKRLNILLIEDGGRIIGIIPLMRTKYGKYPFKLDVLENISSMDPDYSGVILTERKEDCVTAFLSYLAKNINGITLRLSRIVEGCEFLTLMRKQYPLFSSSLSLYERTLTTSPYVPLPATWDEYLASFGSKTRNTLRRKLKSLRKEHNIEFQRCGPDNDIREKVNIFCELHQRGWQNRGLSGALLDDKMREFHVDVANVFSEKGWMNLSFLEVNGKVASAVYGFEYERKFYYGLTGFDPDYSKYSIGQLHTMFLIEEAIKNSLKEFDFLIGAEEYKYRWHALDRGNIQLIVAKKNFVNKIRLKLLDAASLVDKVGEYGLFEAFRRYLRQRRRGVGKRRMQSEV